ncbi:MAG: SRPBCC family protein [Salinivirgaceae bacterium]
MMNIKRASGIYILETSQVLNTTIEQAWGLLSSPENLQRITPPSMGFKITSGGGKAMYAGQIITYKVRIAKWVVNNWVTEITHVKDQYYFIDEQRVGPYRMWHHEHWIRQRADGVEMFDRITYKVPFGFLGHIAHWVFVKRKLLAIFQFRREKLTELFPEK